MLTRRDALLAGLALPALARLRRDARASVYEEDAAFALVELEKRCGSFFDLKSIDWKSVSREIAAAAKKVESDQQHYELLVRLIARLRDGHAEVQPREKTRHVRWPDVERVGGGMSLCRAGKKLYVKTAAGAAAEVGIQPGMEVLAVDGVVAAKWLDARVARFRDFRSFSTDQHALYFAMHGGMSEPASTRWEIELKEPGGKKKKRTITFTRGSWPHGGPAVVPPDLESNDDVAFGAIGGDFGYVYVRRCKESLPELIDAALAKVGGAKGLVLDFRGNGGGGFDHDAFMGRFVPKGEKLAFFDHYESAGPSPYGGNVVVIVDATVISAGETASGIFKEDGRGYMIGESPTAGMSSQKETIELPSGLFGLYVSVASNKKRFNGGRGIEGIGVIPHEIVEQDPEDLAAGRDTLVERALALLAEFPADKVPYRAR